MTFSQNFKENQLKFERVKEAFDLKWPELAENLKSHGINSNEFNIFICPITFIQMIGQVF